MGNLNLCEFDILIAEDSDVNYFLLSELLKPTMAKYCRAKNGVEAIDMIDIYKNISLVLMDINMPVMDGITATKKIREKKVTVPIVFQTAYDSSDNRDECFRAGGNDFLSKPINFDKLYSVLKKYLKKD